MLWPGKTWSQTSVVGAIILGTGAPEQGAQLDQATGHQTTGLSPRYWGGGPARGQPFCAARFHDRRHRADLPSAHGRSSRRRRPDGVNANGARHLAVELCWSFYQRLIAAYAHPDRRCGKAMMTDIFNTLRSGVPAVLKELAQLGRTLWRRRHDVLAYFDHHASNGPTEATLLR